MLGVFIYLISMADKNRKMITGVKIGSAKLFLVILKLKVSPHHYHFLAINLEHSFNLTQKAGLYHWQGPVTKGFPW